MFRMKTALSICLFFTTTIISASEISLDKLLERKEAPEGVVLEIVTGDDKGLNWALPRAERYITQLRQRFPELAIAVVSHGREQFALQRSRKDKEQSVHKKTRSLLQNKVQLHVCGTYASWRGLTEEDFPDYVNVAAAGPSQINDYRALGYELIQISQK